MSKVEKWGPGEGEDQVRQLATLEIVRRAQGGGDVGRRVPIG